MSYPFHPLFGYLFFWFFFFKQKTAYDMRISDWSSDVCSSDLRLRDDGTKRFRLVHRDVGQNLPVEFDARELEPVHELRIGQTLGANAGVDPLDPERAEAALLHLAVAIGVLPGLLHRLTGDADRVLRSEQHTSELQSLMRNSYAVF